MLRGVLCDAVERTAVSNDLSAEDRAKLVIDLLRTVRDFDDASGWYVARYRADPVHPMAAAALHDYLCVAATNAAMHILSAEHRALVINCVLIAFAGGWKVTAVPSVAAEQA